MAEKRKVRKATGALVGATGLSLAAKTAIEEAIDVKKIAKISGKKDFKVDGRQFTVKFSKKYADSYKQRQGIARRPTFATGTRHLGQVFEKVKGKQVSRGRIHGFSPRGGGTGRIDIFLNQGAQGKGVGKHVQAAMAKRLSEFGVKDIKTDVINPKIISTVSKVPGTKIYDLSGSVRLNTPIAKAIIGDAGQNIANNKLFKMIGRSVIKTVKSYVKGKQTPFARYVRSIPNTSASDIFNQVQVQTRNPFHKANLPLNSVKNFKTVNKLNPTRITQYGTKIGVGLGLAAAGAALISNKGKISEKVNEKAKSIVEKGKKLAGKKGRYIFRFIGGRVVPIKV